MRLSVQQASVITVWIVFCANYAPTVRSQQENILFLILEVAENQAGCKLTNHNKIQLFRQRHSHVSTVFFKGFYSSTQCGSGTYIIVLCFLRWDYQEVCVWQVRNRILPCCGLIYTSLVPNRAWEEGYRPLTHPWSRFQTPPSHEEKLPGEPSRISWASAHFCYIVSQ